MTQRAAAEQLGPVRRQLQNVRFAFPVIGIKAPAVKWAANPQLTPRPGLRAALLSFRPGDICASFDRRGVGRDEDSCVHLGRSFGRQSFCQFENLQPFAGVGDAEKCLDQVQVLKVPRGKYNIIVHHRLLLHGRHFSESSTVEMIGSGRCV
jgi:hypothetical protein